MPAAERKPSKDRYCRLTEAGPLRDERAAWLDAVSRDPLLPECLHPRGYAGRESWRRRNAIRERFRGQRLA